MPPPPPALTPIRRFRLAMNLPRGEYSTSLAVMMGGLRTGKKVFHRLHLEDLSNRINNFHLIPARLHGSRGDCPALSLSLEKVYSQLETE